MWCQTTGQWSPSQTSNEHEVLHYVLHSFFPIVLINFGCIGIVGFLLFQLLLMLVLPHRFSVDTFKVMGHGTAFYQLVHECCELQILCHQDKNLIPPCLAFSHSLSHQAFQSHCKHWQCPHQIGWLGSMGNIPCSSTSFMTTV